VTASPQSLNYLTGVFYANIAGLKIKLIDDKFEVYSSKYDAVYNLLN
jgi:hypothetical protein